MTQTQAGAIRPKRFATFPPRLSGHSGALIIFVRHMRHEIFDRFLLHGFPGPGDGKDKAPAACRIGVVPSFDHGHIGLGTIGGITTYDDQLGPTRGYKLAHHLAKQRVFAAILRVPLGQNEAKAHRYAIPLPSRPQHHKAYAKKPGMMLADASFLPDRIVSAAFV